MLDFQPLSTLKQKSRNRLAVENDMRLVLTNIHPSVSRLCTQMQAQQSHWLAQVLFSFAQQRKYSESNTRNQSVSYLVGCYSNIFRVVGNVWGQALMEYFRMGSRDQKGWEPLLQPIVFDANVPHDARTATPGPPTRSRFNDNCEKQASACNVKLHI